MIRQTYFGLRYGMVALSAMLYAGVVFQWLAQHCSQGSISAYYFTPVRPVLIAALSAIGVGLIIYRGNTHRENSILDIAGFLAIIVAFVPTRTPDPNTGCDVSDNLLPPELEANLGTSTAARIEAAYVDRLDSDVMVAIGNSIVALFVAGFLGIFLGKMIQPTSSPAKPPPFDARRSAATGLAVVVLLVAGFVLYLTLDRETFRLVAHPLAAILFFFLILVIIFMNWRGANTSSRYRILYLSTLIVTVALMIVVALLRDVIAWAFWLETVGIAGFATFWLMQSRELGGLIDRDELTQYDTEARR
jgi:hypothetical protein